MERGILTLVIAGLAAGTLAGAANAAGGGSNDSGGGDNGLPSGNMLSLDSLTATVARDFRVRGVLQIDATLDIPDQKLRQRAEMLRPRLRDAYTAALAEYVGGAYQPGRPPDANMIGDMLQAATDRTLGQSGAHLLLGMVVVH